jgi:hypothetical protein
MTHDPYALAAKAGSLEQPNRVLDADIYCMVALEGETTVERTRAGRREGMVVCYYESGTCGTCLAPSYTASVDDARKLWPRGWHIRVSTAGFGMWRVEGWRDSRVDRMADVDVVALTEATARTAAGLLAKAEGAIHG